MLSNMYASLNRQNEGIACVQEQLLKLKEEIEYYHTLDAFAQGGQVNHIFDLIQDLFGTATEHQLVVMFVKSAREPDDLQPTIGQIENDDVHITDEYEIDVLSPDVTFVLSVLFFLPNHTVQDFEFDWISGFDKHPMWKSLYKENAQNGSNEKQKQKS